MFLVTYFQVIHMEDHTQLSYLHHIVELVRLVQVDHKFIVEEDLAQLEVAEPPTRKAAMQGLVALAEQDLLVINDPNKLFKLWGHRQHDLQHFSLEHNVH